MTTTELMKSLMTLSRKSVGLREAALLLAMSKGATVAELAETIGEDKPTIRGRINTLRNKGLIESGFLPEGIAKYTPSKAGHQIIHAATK